MSLLRVSALIPYLNGGLSLLSAVLGWASAGTYWIVVYSLYYYYLNRLCTVDSGKEKCEPWAAVTSNDSSLLYAGCGLLAFSGCLQLALAALSLARPHPSCSAQRTGLLMGGLVVSLLGVVFAAAGLGASVNGFVYSSTNILLEAKEPVRRGPGLGLAASHFTFAVIVLILTICERCFSGTSIASFTASGKLTQPTAVVVGNTALGLDPAQAQGLPSDWVKDGPDSDGSYWVRSSAHWKERYEIERTAS